MSYLLYCIFRSDEGEAYPRTQGVGGGIVKVLGDNGLRAAFSETGSASRVAAPADLLAYARVIDRFNRNRTVIPMRYGCRFARLSSIMELLGQREAEYRALLEELHGCVEMGVRLLLPAKRNNPLAGMSLTARASVGPDATGPCKATRSGTSYLAARSRYYAAEDRVAMTYDRIAADVRGALTGLFFRCVTEFAACGGMTLASLYFLVAKEVLVRFRQAFGRIRMRPDIRVLLSGPWPPYNFVPSPRLLGTVARRRPIHEPHSTR